MMSTTMLIALLPLVAMILGGVVGFGLGRYAAPRAGAWALGLASLACVVLIVRLAAIQPGQEEAGFAPFAGLIAGLFPAIFAGIMGWLGGRALRKRNDRP